MAADVIDLISSSPPSLPPTAPPPSAQPPVDTGTAKHESLSSFSIFSDEDVDINLTAEVPRDVPLKAPSPKRRRISLSPRGMSRTIRPPVLDTTKPKRSNVLDPIEFTSSPAPASQTSQPLLPPPCRSIQENSSSRPSPKSKSTVTVQLPSSDSDPFADTPPPAPRPSVTPVSKVACEPSSDPFASSPELRRQTLRKPNVTSPKPSAIITSPRPLSVINNNISHQSSNRPQRSFDNISSSAPEVCSFRSSPPPSSKKSWDADPDEVINLDDSAPESADELPDITQFDLARPVRRPRSPLRRSRSDVVPGSRARTDKAAPTRRPAPDKAREREAKTASREAEKERKRLEREEIRNAKAREKERAAALAEVNKVRTDKKISTPEMIVDLPAGLNATVNTQVETLLCELGVDHTTRPSPVPNVVRWRRKVASRFNEDAGYWVPVPVSVEEERHALVIVVADEFVNMALQGEVEAHVAKMRRHFAGWQIIYLLEGLTPWMRKNRNIRNRQFTSGMRSQDSSAAPATNRRPRSAPAQEYVSEDIIEDALLELQVVHDVLIHHTALPLETAQWITIFTQHISTIPYKTRKDQATLGAGFCMESGQVRTGDDAGDTYVRMLQEIARVTAPIAYGIAAEFSTVSKLVAGLETGGPLRLEAVRKSANKDGAFSDRTIGQAVSRRLHKVFTGRDDGSTDV